MAIAFCIGFCYTVGSKVASEEVACLKTKIWIMMIAALLALCIGLSLWLMWPGQGMTHAEIWSDGKLLYTVDLRVDQEKTVTTAFGTNVITVREGKIAVTQADCPDHYCMQRGFCDGGAQIVCLPNRLVIKFLAETEIDAVVG